MMDEAHQFVLLHEISPSRRMSILSGCLRCRSSAPTGYRAYLSVTGCRSSAGQPQECFTGPSARGSSTYAKHTYRICSTRTTCASASTESSGINCVHRGPKVGGSCHHTPAHYMPQFFPRTCHTEEQRDSHGKVEIRIMPPVDRSDLAPDVTGRSRSCRMRPSVLPLIMP